MINGRDLAVEIATTGDALWFEAHTDRRMRIRNMVPREFVDVDGPPPVGMAWRTIVVEAQPGARSRQAIALPTSVEIQALGDEDLFDLFLQVAPKGARDVIARMRKMKVPVAPGGGGSSAR